MKITKSQLKQIIKEELEEAQETSYNGKKIVVLFTEVQNKMNELAGELKKLPDDRGYPAKRGPRIAPDVDPGTVDGGMIAMYVDPSGVIMGNDKSLINQRLVSPKDTRKGSRWSKGFSKLGP